ncbi:MAG: hypothetical protein PGN16_08505 [Sphingomonas phyllosphaerae]|uniref:hypothetical protein n=1 Tax=Sphingomonas phyllosphaerae TaxID=257003 RepID=UPI002FFD1CE8
MAAAAQMLDAAVAQRVLNLHSTADYVDVLTDIIRNELWDLRQQVENHGALAAQREGWGQMETLLNLLSDQGRVVGSVAEAFDAAWLQVAA